MSLRKLFFSKSWRNKDDFPTYEYREEQVREDIQLLHDETQQAFNQLIDDLDASEVPFESSTAVPADTVQGAIENVQSQLADVAAGSIPARSVGGESLKESAVGTDELADGSVTGDKIAARAVEGGHIALSTIKGENLEDGTVTNAKLAAGVLPGKADLDDGVVARSQLRFRVKLAPSTEYTLTPADMGSVLICRYVMHTDPSGSYPAPHNFTIPNNDLILPGAVVVLACAGSEGINISAADGVAMYTTGGQYIGVYNIEDDGSTVILIKVSSSEWFVGTLV